MPLKSDNPRLHELYAADQDERAKVYTAIDDVRALKQRDLMRRDALVEMISKGEIVSPQDLYRAAVIFLHGSEPKDFLAAHRLATMSALRGCEPARWLFAATLDRFLVSTGLPQIYGTQFARDPERNEYRLRLPIDDLGLLNFEKRFFNVPPVSERLAELNGRIREK